VREALNPRGGGGGFGQGDVLVNAVYLLLELDPAGYHLDVVIGPDGQAADGRGFRRQGRDLELVAGGPGRAREGARPLHNQGVAVERDDREIPHVLRGQLIGQRSGEMDLLPGVETQQLPRRPVKLADGAAAAERGRLEFDHRRVERDRRVRTEVGYGGPIGEPAQGNGTGGRVYLPRVELNDRWLGQAMRRGGVDLVVVQVEADAIGEGYRLRDRLAVGREGTVHPGGDDVRGSIDQPADRRVPPGVVDQLLAPGEL